MLAGAAGRYFLVVGLVVAAVLIWFAAFWTVYQSLDNSTLTDGLWAAGAVPAALAVITGGFIDRK